jgi:hypothetical protein
MRERVRFGEVGRRVFDVDDAERRAGGRPTTWRLRSWRRAAGPRPVRPGVVPVAVRPAEAPRPSGPAERSVAEQQWDARTGLRILARRPGAVPARYRVRRAVAGVALVAASAVAVVALGLLARLAEPAAAPVPTPVSVAAGAPAPADAPALAGATAPVVVTAGPGETVWDVADRVAPGLSGPRRAALAERIAVDNALSSVRLRTGQVLRVAAG